MEELRFDHADKRRGHVPLAIPRGATFTDHVDRLGFANHGKATKTRGGTLHQGSGEGAGYDSGRHIPDWLQRDGDPESVDWNTVAKYAVLKARLAPSLAKTLWLRLEKRIGRPAAMKAASSPKEAREIGAAWKWIDRYTETRIAPLFRLSAPPVPQQGKAKAKGGFIPPAQVLRSVLEAHTPLRPRRSL